jgi:hypothetical protein
MNSTDKVFPVLVLDNSQVARMLVEHAFLQGLVYCNTRVSSQFPNPSVNKRDRV